MLATNSIIIVKLHYFIIVNWHTHYIVMNSFYHLPRPPMCLMLPDQSPHNTNDNHPTYTHIHRGWDKVSHHCLSLMSLIRVYIALNMCLYHKDKKGPSSSHGPAKTTLASLTTKMILHCFTLWIKCHLHRDAKVSFSPWVFWELKYN